MIALEGTTAVYGLVGQPVAHSLSPRLHNAWMTAYRLPAVYVAFPWDERGAVLTAASTLGLAGFNVTTPAKERVAGELDHLEEEAARVGAVNVVYRRDAAWWGANTDVEGLRRMLEEAALPAPQRLLVLGAGGAARAAWAAWPHAQKRLVNRSLDRARAIAGEAAFGWDALDDALAWAELVVDATRPDAPLRFPSSAFRSGLTWFDLNYWREPPHAGALTAAGVRLFRGDGLLLHQAAAAWGRWFGFEPALDLGRAALRGSTG